MSVFKIKYMTAPTAKHVYCRVFASSSPNETYAALGNLTIRKSEFEDFKRACSGTAFFDDDVETKKEGVR